MLAQASFLTVSRHAALHSPKADLALATVLSSVLAFAAVLALPCDPQDDKSFWACTPPVWASVAFLGFAACDAACVACLYVAISLAPRHLSGGEVALVMELAVGGGLFERLVSEGIYTERRTSRIMQQIALAVYHLHSRGVLHRDIKPENFVFENEARPRLVTIRTFIVAQVACFGRGRGQLPRMTAS